MEIREARHSDLESWVKLRRDLWPHHSLASLRGEAEAVLESPDQTCFLVHDGTGRPCGFAEVAVYRGASGPYTREINSHGGVDGSYAHLEGWYVAPEQRGRGCGQRLIRSVEQWCCQRGITLLTSDTTPSYPLSPDAHERSGFKKIHEFTIFMKELPQDKCRRLPRSRPTEP